MSARRFSQFKQRRVKDAGRGPKPGYDGEAPAATAPGEKTAAWPEAGPAGPMPFNRGTRWPVVKSAAAKRGIS